MGALRWLVELVCKDLVFGAAQMAQHQSLPRQQHFMALRQIFVYNKNHPISIIVFDPKNIDFSDKGAFEADWAESCQYLIEPITPNVIHIYARAM